MSYLHPPPGDAPVIVTKDVGGYVNEYGAQTKLYLDTGREVRLHECRSACTLALSLPTVCVYPDSLLKFHKAYNPLTKVANEEISDQLMDSYPAAVRQRLGDLTRSYKVLTGSELIRLGIRDCNKPLGPNYAVARAKPQPISPDSNVFGRIAEVFSPAGAQPSAVQVKAQRVQVATAQVNPPQPRPQVAPAPIPDVAPAPVPQVAPAAVPEVAPAPETAPEAPLPPPRPANLNVPPPVIPAPPPAAPAPPPKQAAAPPTPVAPPPQQQIKVADGWARRIVGSAPILITTRFTPYPYRMVRKG